MKGIDMNRRQFLTSLSVGAGHLILRDMVRADSQVTSLSTDPFQLVSLGKTGIKVSLIGFGTGIHGGNRESNMTRMGREEGEALLRYGFDKGIRFFDCADMYGTHSYVANALKSIPREKYVLSTKIWVLPGALPEKERPDANIVVDRFRKELNTDYIDMVLIHCMMDPMWPDQQKRQMDLLAELKDKKIIRSHGVSIHSLGALKACAECPWVDSVHTRINAYGQSMDDPDPQVVVPVIRQIHQADKGVVGMKLIGNGEFRDDPEKIDRSLEFVLSLGCVDTMIVGFDKPEQIDDYAQRVQKALAAREIKS
ncbi:MAG: aldo/keto reductase [Sedimentisphaerales bacterium]|nr:aldo/keto reductase [Sedimentisphaerales bacterium]